MGIGLLERATDVINPSVSGADRYNPSTAHAVLDPFVTSDISPNRGITRLTGAALNGNRKENEMKREPIFIPYNVLTPRNNNYQINMKNEVVRHLVAVYRRENKIPYYDPLSDIDRAKFEKLIIRADIKDNDSMVLALKKYESAVKTPERGYTAADIKALRDKILGKEVG